MKYFRRVSFVLHVFCGEIFFIFRKMAFIMIFQFKHIVRLILNWSYVELVDEELKEPFE